MHLIPSFDGTRIAVSAEGPEAAPAILFAHSVGCDRTLWDAQARALAGRFRVIRHDARGHGASDAPAGDYTIETLGRDALAVLDALGIARVHLCGLSLGGTLGQWLALHAPERLLSLALCDTAARLGTAEGWQQRADAALAGGMASLVDMSMTRFFSEGFRARAPEVVARFHQTFLATPPQGFAGCCAVLRDGDFTARLGEIAVPTLVLTGLEDAPTPPADSEILAAGIPGADLVLLDTGHISAVEDPDGFTAALLAHLDRFG
jgi:3-oxoadipate enol-lactonase